MAAESRAAQEEVPKSRPPDPVLVPSEPAKPTTESTRGRSPFVATPRTKARETIVEGQRTEEAGQKRGSDVAVPGVDGKEARRPLVRDTGSTTASAEPAKPTQTIVNPDPPKRTPTLPPPDVPPAVAQGERPTKSEPSSTSTPDIGTNVSPPKAPPAAADPGPLAQSQTRDTIPSPQPLTAVTEVRPTRPGMGEPASAEPQGSGGLGLVRLRLQVDGPTERTTAHAVETLSGAIVAGTALRVVVKAQDTEQSLTLKDGTFQGEVPLQRGTNVLRIVATDAQGAEADVRLTVNYVPPPVPNGIAILAPSDDAALSADDPPVVLVRGRVEDPAISSIRLMANRAQFTVPVRDGSFEQLVPVVDPRVQLIAETARNGIVERRSAPVTIRAAAVPPTGVLFVDWGTAAPRPPAPLRGTWRGRSDRLDSPTAAVQVKTVPGGAASTTDVYYIRGLRTGVYTFVLEPTQAARAPVSARLFLPLAGDQGIRQLTKLRANALGRILVTKLLFPLGMLWDQDDWSSGRSEGSETITKFNMDGVSWIERKEDFR